MQKILPLIVAVLFTVSCGKLMQQVNKEVAQQSQAPKTIETPEQITPPTTATTSTVATSIAIEGKYKANGKNPGGAGSYNGTVEIMKHGDKYHLIWEVGAHYEGMGTLNGNLLSIAWGSKADQPTGVVNYTVQPDGTLVGSWYMNNNPKSLGTENLTPLK